MYVRVVHVLMSVSVSMSVCVCCVGVCVCMYVEIVCKLSYLLQKSPIFQKTAQFSQKEPYFT